MFFVPKKKNEPVPIPAQISKTNHSGNEVFRTFMIKSFVLLFQIQNKNPTALSMGSVRKKAQGVTNYYVTIIMEIPRPFN